ncbi:hypothetical protein JTB14_001937 [Gonioctena quinquepunctata]|nr:hypothetical protein JTB14_001937 [Gonioctena quinquepunctata]
MDWRYILNLKAEDLKDEEKDELFTTITWFEFEKDKLESKKLAALLKVSQEILKYKGEQVETLLHELEEMAIKQAEEESRKQESDTEPRSVRSKKSSSLEYENLEQKYLDLKSKQKNIIRSNEKKDVEISKLNSRVKLLEQDNRRLQNELQSGSHEKGSESDISETTKDKQKELVESLHNKNKQISDLLRDIEDVERENLVLRDKISKVKDELSVATKEMTAMTEILESKEEILKENADNLRRINAQYDDLKKDFHELLDNKNKREQEFEEQLMKVNASLEELKESNNRKDNEIQHLKSLLKEPSLNSSLSSLPKDDPEQSHISALQRALSDREKQLIEVQSQLQVATKEMEESTELLRKITAERGDDSKKIGQLENNIAEMKKLLSAAYERSQNIQDQLVSAEDNFRCKDEELKKIYERMRKNGQVDLVISLEEIDELKHDNRAKRKQIVSLVKTTNKLQETCDRLEQDNYVLRDQLGLPEDQVDMSSFTHKMKRTKKETEALKISLGKKEEQSIQLKMEIHKLNKTISSLANQIISLGEKPDFDNLQSFASKDDCFGKENKVLSEENEALRKGMHEILNSINIKKSTSLNEIKSETFEKLLRALDVKHISGWYHPAMRLQAELHNLEGVNTELRDQLREARKEVEKIRTVPTTQEIKISSEENIGEIQEQDEKNNEYSGFASTEEITVDNIQTRLNDVFKKDADGKNKEAPQKQLLAWFKNILAKKLAVEVNLQSTEETLKKLEEEHEVLLDKLKILLSETDEDKATKIEEVVKSNVSMKRQILHLENEVLRLDNKLGELREDFNTAEIMYTRKVGEMERKHKSLEVNLDISRNLIEISVDSETYNNVKNNLDNMTIKYRELEASVEKHEEENALELNILLETQKNLESEKLDLRNKLIEVSSKLSIQGVQTTDNDIEKLSRKLAEVEVNEIAERQRANHTNNLYDLVREQLNKSEERFQEFKKYNEDLLKKNLVLQEQLRDAEGKICNYIDNNIHNQLQKTNNDLLRENEKLVSLVDRLEEDVKLEKQKQDKKMTWNNSKEQELLNLKHQVVDLISVSDEKVTIAQLNGDILQYRQSQNYYKAKSEELSGELSELKEKKQREIAKLEEEKSFMEEKVVALNKSMWNIRNLFDTLKLQYLGCVPLCSEEIYVNNVVKINKEKHESFISLHKARLLEHEANLLRDQLKMDLEYVDGKQNGGCKEQYHKVVNWNQEKKVFQINELRYRRQSEFKEAQLQHFTERLKMQDDEIARLDEELILWHKNFDGILVQKEVSKNKVPEPARRASKLMKTAEVQTSEEPKENRHEEVNASKDDSRFSTLTIRLAKIKDELAVKDHMVDQLKSKITEHEMTISMFRKQIGDKQSQISFYERHIMELQNKKGEIHVDGAGGDNINVRVEKAGNSGEVLALTATVKDMQDKMKAKDEEIVNYQNLLKVDRDKHSLAAASLQEELQNIQKQLVEEKQKNVNLEEIFSKTRPNRAAIEQYISQVHTLEKHTSELHTKISSLEAQLQSSREEAVRWRTLANDRLGAMEELRQSLDSQHKNELEIYKSDIDKLKELDKDEANSLRQLINKQKIELTGRLDADIRRIIKEKDDRIHELTIKLRQLKSLNTRRSEQPELEMSPKISDLEASLELLAKENEFLKRRNEQLLAKEINTKEENRELKGQLLKKPNTARSDRSEKSVKDQLQKKITTQENELAQLKQTLSEQMAMNETHRVQASEDFDKWKKMKHWQQTTEKLKNKLKERDAEFEKLQQTSAGYRMLIERFEREKHNLENRIKSLKCANVNVPDFKELEILRIENMKLSADVEVLNSKLEMQQHHSGGLGAAMMQEKLEGQERKIAVLEVAAKVSGYQYDE